MSSLSSEKVFDFTSTVLTKRENPRKYQGYIDNTQTREMLYRHFYNDAGTTIIVVVLSHQQYLEMSFVLFEIALLYQYRQR